MCKFVQFLHHLTPFLYLFTYEKEAGLANLFPLLPVYYLDTTFLKILIPTVTTIIAPTTGRAIGRTSPITPVREVATEVKLVVNAVVTDSIHLPLSGHFFRPF